MKVLRYKQAEVSGVLAATHPKRLTLVRGSLLLVLELSQHLFFCSVDPNPGQTHDHHQVSLRIAVRRPSP